MQTGITGSLPYSKLQKMNACRLSKVWINNVTQLIVDFLIVKKLSNSNKNYANMYFY